MLLPALAGIITTRQNHILYKNLLVIYPGNNCVSTMTPTPPRWCAGGRS